jgi:hypothetical protein
MRAGTLVGSFQVTCASSKRPGRRVQTVAGAFLRRDDCHVKNRRWQSPWGSGPLRESPSPSNATTWSLSLWCFEL